jgi:hypothetical protein
MLHDFIHIVPCRDGRGDLIGIEDFDGFVAAAREVERCAAAPCSAADDQDWEFL